jgi:predicted nucleic acid-binding protein
MLVDTSVWVNHFRTADDVLVRLLHDQQVLVHPLVVGEPACGNLPRRAEVLGMLRELPAAPRASHAEALSFIDRQCLMGRGIGYGDVHLLAAAVLAADARLWTTDARLNAAAARLFVAFEPAA